MEQYIPEIAACVVWAPIIGMLVYGVVTSRYNTPRLTRALLLISCVLIGCVASVFVVNRLK